jgi:hypothetical protein
MLGTLHALLALVFVPLFVLFAVIGAMTQPASGNQSGAGAFAIGAAALMALAMPVFYGVFGFIFGIIGAAIYNLVARWIGGIEVEVE